MKPPSPLSCSEPGCLYSGSFKTKWELRRHIASKHRPSQPTLKCCAIGCFKPSQRSSFTRSDKLIEHIRASHHNRSLFECPCQDCAKITLDGLEIFTHLQSHLESRDDTPVTLLRTLANAVSPAFPRCGICGKNYPLHKLIGHLHHDHDDTLSHHSETLREMNLLHAPSWQSNDLSCVPSWERETITDGMASVTAFMFIFVVCPICSILRTTHAEFGIHLAESHMHKDSQHFGIWIVHVEETLTTHGYTPLDQSSGSNIRELLRSAPVWKPWRFALMSSDMVKVCLRCPECKASEDINDSTMATHHLSMLDKSNDLCLYRRKILALCPQFASHPVFEDLRVPDHISEPHVIRLRQSSNIGTKGAPLATYHSDSVEIRKPMGSTTDGLFSTPPSRLDVNNFDISDHHSGIISHTNGAFYNPMVGGCEDRVDARIDTASMSSSLSSDMSSSFCAAYSMGVRAQNTTISNTSRHSCKRFSCEHQHCGLRFERRSDLRLHLRAHVKADERPYKCDLCDRRFMYPKDQERHRAIHSKPSRAPPSRLVVECD